MGTDRRICGIRMISMPGGWAIIKSISGFRGRYYVGRDGRVFSRKKLKDGTVKERELKPSLHPSGYLQVRLSKNGKTENLYVHRLVALTHLPNPKGHSCVRHRDGIKQHNFVANLQWISHTLAQREESEAEALRALYAKHSEEIVEWKNEHDTLKKFSGELLEDKTVNGIAKRLGVPRHHVKYCLQRWFHERRLSKTKEDLRELPT